MSKNAVIIVAGGKGKRFQSNIPKQFLEISGKPVLMHTIEKFWAFDNDIKIILVLPENQINYWQKLCEQHKFSLPHTIVKGGRERFFSVKNGLQIVENEQVIAVHDGVRPLVSVQTIAKGFETASKYGSAVPVVPVTSSVRMIENGENFHIDRANLRIVQTPQVFKSDILKKSYSQNYTDFFTDDASVIEKAGYKIHLFDGNLENIKITTKFDLLFAEVLRKAKHV